jgi:hypothetical protein
MRLKIALLVISVVVGLGNCFPITTIGQSPDDRVVALKVPAPVVSENFVVYAADPIMARKVSSEAERFRKELAQQWLGRELKPWSQKCPIKVQVEMHAGGETSFAFVPAGAGKGKPIDWQMKIFGPPDRILDAVLPHEITHTIFATHFGRPLPRWADEGACTTVEHVSERRKNHKMLMEFLTSQPSRGIPFNKMFTMRNYPHDILPLYAQGYSLAKFLIAQKGHRHFLNFVGKGLQNESRFPELQAWDKATSEFYSYRDLSDLQVSWLGWVRDGSHETNPESLAQANLNSTSKAEPSRPAPTSNVPAQPAQTFTSDSSGSFYVREMNKRQQQRVAANRLGTNEAKKIPVRDPSKSTNNFELDSRLPPEYRSGSGTIWR